MRNACYETTYTPYGEEHATLTTCSTNYKFTGYEQDAETGLYYAFARYYNPRLGRFMSADPLGGDRGNPQSLNRYAYVANNPVNAVDPKGMSVDMTPGGCPAEYITCGSTVDQIFGGAVGGGGGGGASLGNNIFDAVTGTPGTYLSLDMYGNLSSGFSISLYQETERLIDTGFPGDSGDEYTGLGFNVLVQTGASITVTGLVPELAAIQGQAAVQISNIVPNRYLEIIGSEIASGATLNEAENTAGLVAQASGQTSWIGPYLNAIAAFQTAWYNTFLSNLPGVYIP